MGYVDLHCHYLPGLDDGVRTLEEGVALCQGLHRLGYTRVMATPHIRTAMYENRKPALEAAHARFRDATARTAAMPEMGLGAEHYFDDVFWDLFRHGQAVPYTGGKAALVEFPSQRMPLRVDHRLFEMQVRGVRPVIAHPERYPFLFSGTDALDPLLDVGALPLLDIMSLTGRYGRRPRKAAERMLDEGVYFAACSDAHRPADVDTVAEGIARLRSLVGEAEAEALLGDRPQRILDGNVAA